MVWALVVTGNGVKRYFPKDRLAPFASSSTSPPKFGVTPTPQTSAAKTMASRPIPGSSSSKGPISIGKYEITDRFVKPGAQSDWTAQLKKGDIVSVTRHGPNGTSSLSYSLLIEADKTNIFRLF